MLTFSLLLRNGDVFALDKFGIFTNISSVVPISVPRDTSELKFKLIISPPGKRKGGGGGTRVTAGVKTQREGVLVSYTHEKERKEYDAGTPTG